MITELPPEQTEYKKICKIKWSLLGRNEREKIILLTCKTLLQLSNLDKTPINLDVNPKIYFYTFASAVENLISFCAVLMPC